MANFSQESRLSARGTNLIAGKMDYVGTIQEILEVNFRMFKVWIFDVKCFKVICRGAHAIVKRDPSGFFVVDSTTFWGDETDTFVLP